ncbi:hypothetical protein B0H10DRAFT_1964262 [Mycena sp. CBHHK59/15]|nr:hypothetical protein B0H10DRAFT_1964262 [Mycena sp. CBHHK59/15]
MVIDALKPTDPRAISGEINDDYERYLAGNYDRIGLSSFDSSEVSDSCDTTGSDCASIFDSVTDFEADFSLSSCSEPDDTDQSFEPGMSFRNYSLLCDVQVPEFAEQCCYIESSAVSDSELYALSYSLLYATSDAAFDPDRDSFEHTDVQQSDESESDLAAICDLYTNVEHTQLSTPPSSPFSDSYSEPNSITELFLNSFHIEQNSSELSAAFINHEQDAQVDFKLYFTHDMAELSSIPHSTHSSAPSEPESTTHLFIELFYTEQKFPEPRDASSDNERNLDLIHELYFDADTPELSQHFTFIHSTSDSEPASITDMFIESILSQEPSQAIDCEIIASANEHNSRSSTHANFDKDLCTIIELYTEQTESFKRAESQPFSLRTSYAHDFVPELLVSRTKSHAHTRIERTDDPPSYQESYESTELSRADTSFGAKFCVCAPPDQG